MNRGCPSCPDVSIFGDVIYDAGMLIALANAAPGARTRHDEYLKAGRPVVPAPVVAQAWRGGAKVALLARALKDCAIVACYTHSEWRRIGEWVGRATLASKKAPDVVDCLVAYTAVDTGATVVATADTDDINAYLTVIPGGDAVSALAV